ncbi:MAG: porin [Acidobacteria bacterium]|nr:porin [Acidobacteriota bacterium]MCG3191031.1 hypothetical protein [Thermoanaerobaculia bacterium]
MSRSMNPLRYFGIPLLTVAAAVLHAASVQGQTISTEGQASPAATSPAGTTAEAPAAKAWYSEITVNGFVSASYSYNFNKPASGLNTFRVFDFDDNTIKLDVAELVIQKAVSKPGEAGFRVDATAGGSLPRMTAASGLFRDPATGKAEDFDLQQAFVSWIAPVGSGLRLDAGKFVTPAGYELIDGYDGFNDNATRGFLFGYALPFTHTGLKATYAFSDQVSGSFMIVNGWDNAKDNNSSKTIGLSLGLTPTPKFSLAANFLTGPERTDVNSDPRSLFDLVAIFKPSGTATIALEFDYGSEKGAVVPGETASYWGLAGFLKVGLTSSFALGFRGEYFDDQDGARTGVSQALKSLTLTPEFKLTPNLVFRSDLRVDFSDANVFEAKAGEAPKKEQATILLNALYFF